MIAPQSPAGSAAGDLSVVLADDNPEMLAALVALFDQEPGFTVVGTAMTTPELIALVRREGPDVAVVDVRMPGGGAPAAAGPLLEHSPRTVLIALSAHALGVPDLRLTEVGAIGPLSKAGPSERLLDVIRTAVAEQRSHPMA